MWWCSDIGLAPSHHYPTLPRCMTPTFYFTKGTGCSLFRQARLEVWEGRGKVRWRVTLRHTGAALGFPEGEVDRCLRGHMAALWPPNLKLPQRKLSVSYSRRASHLWGLSFVNIIPATSSVNNQILVIIYNLSSHVQQLIVRWRKYKTRERQQTEAWRDKLQLTKKTSWLNVHEWWHDSFL